ncbi:hypothetical protein Leryth_006380 [Lithospermum erythrorhizon]|nr:hypothetical protein Leryth_006380 [Lithospermum erythrorhizon]
MHVSFNKPVKHSRLLTSFQNGSIDATREQQTSSLGRSKQIIYAPRIEQYKDRRRRSWHPEIDSQYRILCCRRRYITFQGKVPLISKLGVHQLHIFIFVLAVFHVLYSMITMFLAQAKVCHLVLFGFLFFMAFILLYVNRDKEKHVHLSLDEEMESLGTGNNFLRISIL